ncbi:MAG: hypothetical protein IT204_16250 [Fimbriimonadaceae bacterium]|nr:hypothetical protein [Fimbriimonadaceae bacterium]
MMVTDPDAMVLIRAAHRQRALRLFGRVDRQWVLEVLPPGSAVALLVRVADYRLARQLPALDPWQLPRH